MSPTTEKPLLVAIVGPTASGKTEASLSMARQHNGAVVSADSRQVYVGMNVGTAKPSAINSGLHDPMTTDLIAGIDHYLFNIRQPDDELTLAQWREAAYSVIDHIVGQGQLPILAGGTMLYTESIHKNYTLPSVPADLAFRKSKQELPTEDLYQELMTKDPQAKEFIEPENTRRIVRALEVIAATGQPFSSQRKEQPPRYKIDLHGVFPGWPIIETRIRRRVTSMLSGSLLSETKQLIAQYGAELPLLKTINYAQAVQILQGELSPEEAPEKMYQANLKYAKRQMNWWKRNSAISWHNTATDLNNTVKIP